MDKSGNSEEPINLDYLPLEKLRELITANDEKALNYYSIDEGLLYYATYREVITTVNGEQTDRTYEITENPPISYETITNMCNMPFNYLFTLLQESKNPDWVMAVIDLLLENSKVVLMIQDQLNVVTYTKVEKEYHVQKTEVEHYKEIEEHYGNETHTYWELESVDTSYDFPVGEPVVTTTVITTYTNTANVYIKEAHTWCIDFEQEATKVETITPGDEVTTLESYSSGDFGGLGYILVSTSGGVPTITRTYISARTLLYSTSEKQDVADYRFEVSPKYKEINYKKFLGLWKNKEGKYIKGEEYDENGKEVAYALPDEDTAKYYIPEKISDENGQNINELLELLRLHNNTEHHEQLMMYYWNVWMGEEIYDVDLDAILDLFDEKVFSSLIGGSIYGSSAEEKVWYAMIEAGFSEYATAGAMGNFYWESGFKCNNLQDTSETSLGMSDEEYTTAVDNGTYTNFVNDSGGYGLAQWTTSDRKEGLLSYAHDKGVSISDENMQIEYLLAELGISNAASSKATYQLLSRHGYDGDSWKNAENETEAATAFCYSFERPKDGGGIPRRVSKAIEYYDKYHGKTRPEFTVETIQGGNFMFPHYLQRSYPKNLYKFGPSTIYSAGCGPTSLAMILAGLKGEPSIDPPSVVRNLEDNWPNWNSYFVLNVGSKGTIYSNSFLNKYYGVSSISGPSQSQALEALAAGYPVMRRRRRTYFSNNASN